MKLPAVFDLPVIMVRHRELLWSFVRRDLKARYEGSLLGRLWPVLNPLILFGVYFFVFVVIMRQKLEAAGAHEIAPDSLMGLYIISGILPWIAFSDGLLRSTGVVLENGNLVKKIAFPSQLLPVYAIIVNLVYFLIALLLFVAVRIVFFGGLPATWPALLIAVPLQFVFSVGLGLLLGALNIFIRDTSQIIALILQLWFFLTPIVYPSKLIDDMLAERDLTQYAYLMKANPLFHLFELYRAGLVHDPGGIPWASAGTFALMALVTFVPGYAFFLATKGRFADEL